MSHLGVEAVVPGLLVNGERPTLRGPSLLDGVAVAALAVGMNGVAAEQVGVGHSLAAVDLRPVVHAARLGPTLLRDGRGPAVHLEDEGTAITALGLVAVDVGAHVGVAATDVGLASLGSAQQPAEELDGMAPHVQCDPAAAPAHIPEPRRMGAVVLLRL